MNRQERRKKEREIEKDMNLIRKLPANEVKKINEIIEKVTKTKTEQAMNIIDRSMSAILVSRDWTFKEIREMQDELAEFMREDADKIKELEKENVDMTKLQAEVKEYMVGLVRQGVLTKQGVIKETLFKFPKLSKTAANNAFGKIQEELELEDAASYILEDNKEVKKVVEKEAKKIAKEVVRNLEKQISEEKHNSYVGQKADELEVIEEVVIKEVKLKGKNGLYEAKTGVGVALENEGCKLAFKDIKELEMFCSEFKKVFERI